MGKQLFIAEKPSVAAEFAKALKVNGGRKDGYLESDQYVVTWCVGHLITMSYPEVYDPVLKKWSLNTIPFFPEEWKYEVIGSVKKQFAIVKGLLNRADVDTIYIRLYINLYTLIRIFHYNPDHYYCNHRVGRIKLYRCFRSHRKRYFLSRFF